MQSAQARAAFCPLRRPGRRSFQIQTYSGSTYAIDTAQRLWRRARGPEAPEMRTECGKYSDVHWDGDFGLVMRCPPLITGIDARRINSSRIASVKCSAIGNREAIDVPPIAVDCWDCLENEIADLGDLFAAAVSNSARPLLEFVSCTEHGEHWLCLRRQISLTRERAFLVVERYDGEHYTECSMPLDDTVEITRRLFSARIALTFANLRPLL